jgi:8-hydroxy-5-deazaflavin:NADPH oxidoreductase
MRTLIIGAGNMGRGIATRLLAGGNDIVLHDIDSNAASELAAELKAAGSKGTVRVGTPATDAATSDVIILASWYGANLDLARQFAGAFDGKVVVDISNPLNDTFDGLVTAPGISAAETIRDVLTPSTRVVKAFNTTFAGTLVDGNVSGQPLDVFIAGDDQAARGVVAALVRSGGMNPIEAGGLERARELEGLAFLGITMQGKLGTGFRSGWKLVTPKAA